MTLHNGDGHWAPSPEQLAAYADGELGRCLQGSKLRQRIEEWLAGHPQAAAEVNALQRLDRLWKKTAAAEPSEAAWEAVWNRIDNPATVVERKNAGKRFKVGWAAALLLVAAAAVVLAVVLSPSPSDRPDDRETVEPFPVAGADEIEVLAVDGDDTSTIVVGRLPVTGDLATATSQEVEILRVNGADTQYIVVGELPVQGPMVLAKAGDVSLVRVDPALDNMKPETKLDGPDAPMIWAPLAPDPGK